jgi:hypothetical protein
MIRWAEDQRAIEIGRCSRGQFLFEGGSGLCTSHVFPGLQRGMRGLCGSGLKTYQKYNGPTGPKEMNWDFAFHVVYLDRDKILIFKFSQRVSDIGTVILVVYRLPLNPIDPRANACY